MGIDTKYLNDSGAVHYEKIDTAADSILDFETGSPYQLIEYHFGYFFAVSGMSHWYSGCSNLTMTPMIPSSVEKMQFTFADCTSLTNAPDLTGCTSLTDMTASFYYCTSLTDMSSYMISAGVKNMSQTFQGCTKLTTAPTIPSSVENMGSTFQGCTSLTTAPTIPSSVTEMTGTFNGCSALTGTMLIKASPTSGNYSNCFGGASTNTGTDLKVTCMVC